MEIGPIDEKSGRHLIEGKGMPIDGGVFRKAGEPGLVADIKYFQNKPWFTEDDILVTSLNRDMLKMVTYLAGKRMPVNLEHYNSVVDGVGKYDRYALSSFISQKDPAGKEIGGGSPDVQALYTAFLIEKKVKSDTDRKVWIEKDKDDGHAIVNYEGRSGSYRFDPTKGETNFSKLE